MLWVSLSGSAKAPRRFCESLSNKGFVGNLLGDPSVLLSSRAEEKDASGSSFARNCRLCSHKPLTLNPKP